MEDIVYIFYNSNKILGNSSRYNVTIIRNTDKGKKCEFINCETKEVLQKRLDSILKDDVDCILANAKDLQSYRKSKLLETIID